MDTKEHYYSDDPSQKHIDAKTTLKDGRYYFLGNGRIQVAIQVCTSDEGTPLGLLIMDPEKFGPKSDALTFDEQNGLFATQLQVRIGDQTFLPAPETLCAQWSDIHNVPAVKAVWQTEAISVEELFFCPDLDSGRLIRQISITNLMQEKAVVHLQTGFREMELQTSEKITTSASFGFEYELSPLQHKLKLRQLAETVCCPAQAAVRAWQNTSQCSINAALDHLFNAGKNQIAGNISHQGIMDASIWQYNLEWVRDSANIVMGLTMAGHHQSARALLQRMLQHNVTDKGDAVDSGQVRPLKETELDQNGKLLLALKTFIDWTGDTDLVKTCWHKIEALAEFPFQDELMHKSGLLHNQREFWERHSAYGVEDGFELCYQVFVSIGLSSAAELARLVGKENIAAKWQKQADSIKKAVLSDPTYAMIENGHFIKRKDLQGRQQKTITPDSQQYIPQSVPIKQDTAHYIDPDSSSVYPIILEFIDPKSDLAQNTLLEMEKLWNQKWTFGGYSRYNVTSEPDSAAPWPLASTLIAQANLQAGNHDKVWRVLNWLHTLAGARSGTWYEIYGNRPVPPYAQIGVIPWAWAEIVKFFIHHLFGVRPAQKKLVLKPHLLQGLQRARCRLRCHRITLTLTLLRRDKAGEKGYRVNGEFKKADTNVIEMDMPQRDTQITVFV